MAYKYTFLDFWGQLIFVVKYLFKRIFKGKEMKI